jgi:CRP-like cAMP-binding protein
MLQASSSPVGNTATIANRLLLEIMQTATGLDASARPVTLERGQVLNEEGRVPAHVVFPEGALLADMACLDDGRMIEVAAVGLEGAANLLGALTGAASHHQTVVKVAGAARLMKAASLRAALPADPALQKLLLMALRRRAVETEQAIACSLAHDATRRLARALLATRDRLGADLLPLTQDDFATTLGVQRTTLNASALQLKADGAVRYSRGMLRVLDPSKLAARACECHDRVGRGPDGSAEAAVSTAGGLRVVSRT